MQTEQLQTHLNPHHAPIAAGALSPSAAQDVSLLARKQDDIAHARENLLVERSAVRSQAVSVRQQRQLTANTEVKLMNALRQYFVGRRGSFPQYLDDLYRETEKERERLATVEDDYLLAEQNLGGSEWTFLEKERVFYQYDLPNSLAGDAPHQPSRTAPHPCRPPPPPFPPPLPPGAGVVIVTDAPPPPPPPPTTVPTSPMYHSHRSQTPAEPFPSPTNEIHGRLGLDQRRQQAEEELVRLRKEFGLLRAEQSKHLVLDLGKKRSDLYADASTAPRGFKDSDELLGKIADCEVRIQRLNQERMQYDGMGTLLDRRMSDPVHGENRPIAPFDAVTRAQTDSILRTLSDRTPPKVRVRDWLLEFYRNNAIEKTRYSNILEQAGISLSNHSTLEDCPEPSLSLGLSDLPATSDSKHHAHGASKIPAPGQTLSVNRYSYESSSSLLDPLDSPARLPGRSARSDPGCFNSVDMSGIAFGSGLGQDSNHWSPFRTDGEGIFKPSKTMWEQDISSSWKEQKSLSAHASQRKPRGEPSSMPRYNYKRPYFKSPRVAWRACQ